MDCILLLSFFNLLLICKISLLHVWYHNNFICKKISWFKYQSKNYFWKKISFSTEDDKWTWSTKKVYPS